jgi:hypothetical protein
VAALSSVNLSLVGAQTLTQSGVVRVVCRREDTTSPVLGLSVATLTAIRVETLTSG